MNTNPDKLAAYREQMRQGTTTWQKNTPPRPALEEPGLDNGVTTAAPYDDIPGLKKVSELQFGDIFRQYEGPSMGEFVKPHEGWRTFHGTESTETPWLTMLSSSRLGHVSTAPYADIDRRRFQVLSREDADSKGLAY